LWRNLGIDWSSEIDHLWNKQQQQRQKDEREKYTFLWGSCAIFRIVRYSWFFLHLVNGRGRSLFPATFSFFPRIKGNSGDLRIEKKI
jgi:hypothetical protein